MELNDKVTTESDDEPARKRIRPGMCLLILNGDQKEIRNDSLEEFSHHLDPSPNNNPEENVGITQFLSNHEGFDGIIKYR